jgi:Serine carboxypeptidase S28
LVSSFDIDYCADVFGPQFTREVIDANVRRTNANYGGALGYNVGMSHHQAHQRATTSVDLLSLLQGTNVVFANGSEDPWHALSVYHPLNVNVTSVLIDGTSHCKDMFAEGKADTDALKAGRKQIKAVLDSWLGK